MRLDGKTAFITGGAQGIGLATAKAFVTEGARVAIADINGDRAAQEAVGLGSDKAIGVSLDVGDGAAVKAAIDQAANHFGRLDILVAGAAVMTPGVSIEDLEEDDWDAAIRVNLKGAFLVAKHGIGHLRKSGKGSIILIASQMGRVAWAGSTAYCTTKGGLLQMAKGIALDHVGDGIRANTLSPGGTATDRLSIKFGDMDTAEREWGPKHPMGRLGRVEEIAAGAVYLASDESSFMTGTDLLLDGGYSAW
jgi:NAD(P)-dependent dehydrogenase (short-subunit alcohol dehydrogenase family)